MIDGKKYELKGTALKLSQGSKVVVWRYFASAPPSSPKISWSGDFAFPAKKDVIFILLSNGGRFWIQKVSSSAKMTDAKEDEGSYATDADLAVSGPILPPPSVSLRLPAILSAKIKVMADNLALTFNADKQTGQQWLYSLTTHR